MSCRLIFTKGCATLRAMGPCHPAPALLAKRWRREPTLLSELDAELPFTQNRPRLWLWP